MVSDFFYKYFVSPINNFEGYNPVNTIVYFAILFIASFYIIFPFLDKKEVKFNKKFVFSLMPYIFFGVMLRVINARIVSDNLAIEKGIQVSDALNLGTLITQTANPLTIGFWMFTPGVWISTFTVTILGLWFSKLLSKKTRWKTEKIFFLTGLLVLSPLLLIVLLNFRDYYNFFLVLTSILLIFFAVTLVLKKIFSFLLKSTLNKLALLGQIIDSTSTFFAVSFFGYGEQHFVSSAILGFNPALFIIIKIVFILLILYFVDKEYSENTNLKGFIKTLLIILGFATGGASLFKIGLIGSL